MVLNTNVVEIVRGRTLSSGGRFAEIELPAQPPNVPVLPETVLRIELNLGGPSVSLREISRLLLGDLGAALQVFRLAGCEPGFVAEQYNRIEDCISHLGIQTCIDAVSRQIITRDTRKNAVIEAWAHAGAIAGLSALWAEINDVAIDPSEAYLVGLFHELGSLPALLGWDPKMWRIKDTHSMGLRIAAQCSLPRCIREYFSESRAVESTFRWREVVDGAHLLANQSSIEPVSNSMSTLHENQAS